jgi:hypothetical protein
MARQRADFNWRGIARILFLAALVFLVINTMDANKCVFASMGDAELQTEAEREALTEQTRDVGRVSTARGFFGRFFGSIGPCYEAHPIGHNEQWKQYALFGTAGGALLFWLLGRLFSPRYRAG